MTSVRPLLGQVRRPWLRDEWDQILEAATWGDASRGQEGLPELLDK